MRTNKQTNIYRDIFASHSRSLLQTPCRTSSTRGAADRLPRATADAAARRADTRRVQGRATLRLCDLFDQSTLRPFVVVHDFIFI